MPAVQHGSERVALAQGAPDREALFRHQTVTCLADRPAVDPVALTDIDARGLATEIEIETGEDATEVVAQREDSLHEEVPPVAARQGPSPAETTAGSASDLLGAIETGIEIGIGLAIETAIETGRRNVSATANEIVIVTETSAKRTAIELGTVMTYGRMTSLLMGIMF